MTKIRIQAEKFNFDEQKVVLFETQVPDAVVQFAMTIIDRHAVVAATPDGEDTAGRQRMRMQTPAELVDRAFAIAEATYAKALETGRMVAIPDLNVINSEIDAERDLERRQRQERDAVKRSVAAAHPG